MKKNIILMLLASVLFLFACEKEHKVEFYDLGSEFYTSSSGITTLDDQTTITVENPLTNLTSISVARTQIDSASGETHSTSVANLGTVSISGDKGTLNLTDAQLGLEDAGWISYLDLDAVIDGKPFTRHHEIEMESPFSTEDPGITHKDTVYHMLYEVTPVSVTVSSVTIEAKVGVNATYAEVTRTAAWAAEDSVGFNGSDYEINDTIFVRITAAAANGKSDTDVTKLVVEPESYKNVSTFKLDYTDTPIEYDLISDSLAAHDDSVDVYLDFAGEPVDDEASVFRISSAPGKMIFIKGGVDDYTNADMIDVEATDFSAATNKTTNIKVGDVFIFRTYHGTMPTDPADFTYGVMIVTAIETPDGGIGGTEVTIEYKY